MTQTIGSDRRALPALLLAVLSCVFLWSYWTTLGETSARWAYDAQYSHGYLVPIFAMVLLWLRRREIAAQRWSPCWWGLALLGAAVGARLVGAYFHFVWLDAASLLPCLAGMCLLVAGSAYLRWAGPAIAFLFFMIPLPYRLATALSGPLQTIATEGSAFALRLLGRPAIAEGNVILLNEVDLGVVEACSGLRMLMVFFALSTAVALVIRKPLWEKLLVCASAAPIALLANILRISVTGMLKENDLGEAADAFFHDVAGWLMMPLALGLLGLELKLLNHVLLDPPGRASGDNERRWRRDGVSPVARGRHARSESAFPRHLCGGVDP
jgi:exosortase